MEEEKKFTVDDITIEDMMNNIFTKKDVKKKRKEIVAYYMQRLNLDLFGVESDSGEPVTEEAIAKKVENILKEDKNSQYPFLKYSNSQYSKKPRVPGGDLRPLPDNRVVDSNYMGKAGECAVMSELLFRGYNVNNMMVDEGIDLVASKNNVFYYIQVKTRSLSQQNRFLFQISQERFDTFVGTQIRYILVARCIYNKEERNFFFMFANNDILRLMQENAIPKPADGSSRLSLKIEYDIRTGQAFMYDGRYKSNVTFYMNNFNL